LQSTVRRNLPDDELEALLDAAENEVTAATIETIPVQDEVVIFLKHYDIKSGDHLVNAKILHNIYKLWSKNPKNFIEFQMVLSIALNQKWKGQREFKIDKDFKSVWDNMELVKRRRRRRGHLNTMTERRVEAFFNERSIKPGKYWVDIDRLYEMYVKWSGRKNLGVKRFKEFCWGKFEKKKTFDDKEWLRLDESVKEYIRREDEEKKEAHSKGSN